MNIKSAHILCVGTELLLGDIVNTNAAFLSQRLAELGISVYRHSVVGDNPERLKSVLADAIGSADLVITSGGLGPTYDDLTKETVAEFFGREMRLDLHSLERIEAYFKRVGRVMTDNNRKQAMMPEGAIIFDNDYGTAPALAIEGENGKTVIMLCCKGLLHAVHLLLADIQLGKTAEVVIFKGVLCNCEHSHDCVAHGTDFFLGFLGVNKLLGLHFLGDAGEIDSMVANALQVIQNVEISTDGHFIAGTDLGGKLD